jgi:hypothetical protein
MDNSRKAFACTLEFVRRRSKYIFIASFAGSIKIVAFGGDSKKTEAVKAQIFQRTFLTCSSLN